MEISNIKFVKMSLDDLNPPQGFSPMLSLCFLAFAVRVVHDSFLYEVKLAASNRLIAEIKMTFSHFLQKSKEFYTSTPLLKCVINQCS